MMNKKEINVNEEMEKLKEKHKNIPTLRLFSGAHYEELYGTNALEMNKQEIDKLFKNWEGITIIEVYQKYGTEKLVEEYGANITVVISEYKSELSKNIKQFKSKVYVSYYFNEKAVNYILKPTLKYLLEKQKEIDVIIAKIRRELKSIN